jgi:hypothetical protein
MPSWEAQRYRRAGEMYRTVVMAGDEGVLLRELATTDREREALKLLRASGALAEWSERRPDAAGRVREQIVLRAHRA